jgi:hypothetical protein
VTTMLDLDAIRSRQQKTWASGNYAAADPARIHAVSERPAAAADLPAGTCVPDVATGIGKDARRAAQDCNM